MPTTRKSSRLSSGAPGTKQSTLSFNHRVTKPTVTKSAKDNLVKPPSTKEIPSKDESPVESRPTSPETSVLPEEEAEKSEAEIRAAQISDAAIKRYWGTIEGGRMAKGVHKKHGEGLTVGEKVLRYFDVSSHYGVCFENFFMLILILKYVANYWGKNSHASVSPG